MTEAAKWNTDIIHFIIYTHICFLYCDTSKCIQANAVIHIHVFIQQSYPDCLITWLKPAFWDRSHKAGYTSVLFGHKLYIKQNSNLQVLSLTSLCFLSLLLHVLFLLIVTASLQILDTEHMVTGIFIRLISSLFHGSPPKAGTNNRTEITRLI